MKEITKIVTQMGDIFQHLHLNQVCHGDLYAHNTLFDESANIIVGDFDAATMYHMLTEKQQSSVQKIERGTFNYFIDDLFSICQQQDRHSSELTMLEKKAAQNNNR